jgi:uncharacterized protein (DUF1501 family)
MTFTRRDFLRNSALVALAPAVPTFLACSAQATPANRDDRALVVIQLSGGNDGINTVVPYADEAYPRLRPHLRLPAARLRRINDEVALHPELGDFARLLEDGRLAILQGVGYPNPNRSHFRSMAYWHTARLGEPAGDAATGWLGRALEGARQAGVRAPVSISVGLRPPPRAVRGRRSAPTSLAHLEDLRLAGNDQLGRAFPEVGAGDDVRAFVHRSVLDAYAGADRLREVAPGEERGARYPDTGLAHDLRIVARLMKAGFGTRVYYVEQNSSGDTAGRSYDTHEAQLTTHERLLAELGGAIRAFLEDLRAARLEDRVAVLCFSEFGRRAAENGSFGTDHGAAGPVFLAGGQVRAGLVGQPPRLGDLVNGDVRMQVDFRRVYATILEDWLGLAARGTLGGQFEKLPLFRGQPG